MCFFPPYTHLLIIKSYSALYICFVQIESGDGRDEPSFLAANPSIQSVKVCCLVGTSRANLVKCMAIHILIMQLLCLGGPEHFHTLSFNTFQGGLFQWNSWEKQFAFPID